MLKVLHKPLGDDPRHDLACVMFPLAAAETQREGEGGGEVLRLAAFPNRCFPLLSGGSNPSIEYRALSGGGQIMPTHNLAWLGGTPTAQ